MEFDVACEIGREKGRARFLVGGLDLHRGSERLKD
jgi:hypothetical protein